MKEKEAKALEAEKSYVSLKNINKIYENKFQAVYDFNLESAKKNSLFLSVLQAVANQRH